MSSGLLDFMGNMFCMICRQ